MIKYCSNSLSRHGIVMPSLNFVCVSHNNMMLVLNIM